MIFPFLNLERSTIMEGMKKRKSKKKTIYLLNDIHYKKNQYYLQNFTHRSESVGKFSITYGQHYLQTLPTNSEFVSKFSITYQPLPTDLITYQLLPTYFITYQLLPTNLYYLPTITHKSLLPTNYHPRISITFQLLP